MFRFLVAMLIGCSLVPAFGQTKSDYQPGTIMAVVARPNTSGDDSVTGYDVPVQVGNRLYVVLYTPPLGSGTPQYAAGRELLVKVGEKAITFNDMLGESHELPIESSSPVASTARQSSDCESPQAAVKATVVTGLPGIKNKSTGNLSIDKGDLHFVGSKNAADIPLSSVTDVATGSDKQGGADATSDGNGRFLRPVHSKRDSLTIQYRDANGGLRGVIFTMPVGQAEPFKQRLVKAGAHTTVASDNSGR